MKAELCLEPDLPHLLELGPWTRRQNHKLTKSPGEQERLQLEKRLKWACEVRWCMLPVALPDLAKQNVNLNMQRGQSLHEAGISVSTVGYCHTHYFFSTNFKIRDLLLQIIHPLYLWLFWGLPIIETEALSLGWYIAILRGCEGRKWGPLVRKHNLLEP